MSALKRFWCSRREVAVFNDPYCFQILIGTVLTLTGQEKKLWGILCKLMKGIFALLRRDIRARLHHCWANSMVNVCDATLKGIADQSGGAPEEMRAARSLTVLCTLYHSCARAGHESTELGNVFTKSTRNGCLVSILACNEIAHLRFVRVN